MYVMLREGTCSHDLANLSPMLLENPARARRCCFATDDRAPSDALSTGMIDNACRVAIEAGIDPVVASLWRPFLRPRRLVWTTVVATRTSSAAQSPRASALTCCCSMT